MSLNLKQRDKLDYVLKIGRNERQDALKGQQYGSEAARYLLVDKLLFFEGSPGGVGGLCVVRVLLWHLVRLIYKAYRYQ